MNIKTDEIFFVGRLVSNEESLTKFDRIYKVGSIEYVSGYTNIGEEDGYEDIGEAMSELTNTYEWAMKEGRRDYESAFVIVNENNELIDFSLEQSAKKYFKEDRLHLRSAVVPALENNKRDWSERDFTFEDNSTLTFSYNPVFDYAKAKDKQNAELSYRAKTEDGLEASGTFSLKNGAIIDDPNFEKLLTNFARYLRPVVFCFPDKAEGEKTYTPLQERNRKAMVEEAYQKSLIAVDIKLEKDHDFAKPSHNNDLPEREK